MRRVLRSFFKKHERGQMIMLTAGLLPVLLGMAGLAIDLGSFSAERRSLQNDADSIALAAAQELPNASSASTVAQTWAVKNDVDWSKVTFAVSGGTTAPVVTVTINKSHSFSFIKVLGVSSHGIGAKAAAGKFSPAGVGALMPWAVTQDIIDASPSGSLVTLHGAKNSPGNFGGFDIDGKGGSVYRETIKYGSDGIACAVNTPKCTKADCTSGAFPSACAENADACNGPYCTSEPGMKTGPTDQGVQDRFDETVAACDTFGEVFTQLTSYADTSSDDAGALAAASFSGGGRLFSPPVAPNLKQPTNTPTNSPTITPVPTSTNTPTNTPTRTNTPTLTSTPTRTSTPVPPTSTATSTPTRTNTPGPSPTPTLTTVPTSTPNSSGPTYGLNPMCNPWGGGACPHSSSETTANCSGRVVLIPIIDAFGNGRKESEIQEFAMFFLESSSGADVTGRFVRANATINALTGVYDPTSSIHFVKLIE